MINNISSAEFRKSFMNSIISANNSGNGANAQNTPNGGNIMTPITQDTFTKKKNPKKIIFGSIPVGLGAIGGGVLGRVNHKLDLDDAISEYANKANKLEDFIKRDGTIGIEEKELFQLHDTSKPYFEMRNIIDCIKTKVDVERPNCVLFTGENKEKKRAIIDWFASKTGSNYKRINLDSDNLVETLEGLEEQFQRTGKRNTLYVENMDKAIKKGSSMISSMKRVMCATGEDFHTSILFDAVNCADLDPIAIETNRVNGILNVDAMKHFDEFKNLFEDANSSFNKVVDLKHQKLPWLKYAIGGGAIAALWVGIFCAAKPFIKKKINKAFPTLQNPN